jgi:50S ribosomal subunit-associated GTPase HflX
VLVSAVTGDGIDRLIAMIRDRQLAGGEVMTLLIPHAEARTVAALHEFAEVHSSAEVDEGTRLSAWVPREVRHRFEAFQVYDDAR